MADRLYERTTVPHGDKHVRAQLVRCGQDGCSEALTFIDTGATYAPPEVITKKARAAGWRVGHNPRRDRCPAHHGRQQEGQDMAANGRNHGGAGRTIGEIYKGELPAQTREVHATHIVAKSGEVTLIPSEERETRAEPRLMDRDDRRLIFGELDTLYLDAKQGYKPGASDQIIAESLGVPVLWVRNVREEMFGPADGDKRTKQVQELRARLDALNPKIMAVTKDVTALMDEAQAIHLALKTLEGK